MVASAGCPSILKPMPERALADQGLDYLRDLGFPGQYPFTRGIYPSMYRGRLWTMRQYAGFGTARETNRRFRYMLERGMTGINVAFDLPGQHGLALERLSGSTQNDILKEFIARGTYIFPPRPSLRLVTDIIEYCAERLPRWNFINVCGYHMREAGSTLVQEAGFALADAMTYVQAALDRGEIGRA